ncbi:SurA N-terminal domain-containing protein [Qipengyuania sp.]|uniref:SurA N-terminal domain-containing protein n=1 Tax=Qipengyuania sp. TaxID=2004515 RepID=UPI0035C7E642
MLSFFRNIFKSKLGLLLTLVFLGLIALAFASADVANTAGGGQGLSTGENAAVVGETEITQTMLARAASAALERAREQNPTLSMPAFIAQGGLQATLNQLIDRAAISEYARLQGLRAGDNLVNSEIRQIGAFRGADGNFSADAYKAALAAQGISDGMVRDDLASGLLAQQLLGSSSVGLRYPQAATTQYARLFKERRTGSIGLLSSAAFAPTGDPDAATLSQFYQSARSRFIRPERRVLRYALFGPAQVQGRIAPTEAEITARYQENIAQYRAREQRSFTQLVVPTKQAADAIVQQVAGGTSLDAAARAAGLRTSQLSDVGRASLVDSASEAVAKAYFEAAEGSLTAPARSALGWQIARVDNVERIAGISRDAAAPAIRESLTAENRVRVLSDLAARAEEELDGGATLAEIAREIGVEPKSTAPLTADGRAYAAGTTEGVPDDLRPVLATAFQMDESMPQVAQVPDTESFVIFEVNRITPSAVAPLAEIRDDVTSVWRQSVGSQRAKAAADRILAKVGKGSTLAAAMAAEKVSIPAPENVSMTRQALLEQGGRTPPPLALLFSMAQGTAKRLEAPANAGWYVVDLDRVELGKLENNDPIAAQINSELSTAFSQELAQQAVLAMREAVGVARNPEALEAVRRQLTGEN